MLIPSRNPKLHAKRNDLPLIPYGTLKVPKPFMSGWMTSYQFFEKDVQAIAKAVHGDVEAYTEARRQRRVERERNRTREVHRKLKVRYHKDQQDVAESKEELTYHRKRTYLVWLGHCYILIVMQVSNTTRVPTTTQMTTPRQTKAVMDMGTTEMSTRNSARGPAITVMKTNCASTTRGSDEAMSGDGVTA